MLSYLETQLFSLEKGVPPLQSFDKILMELQNDNHTLQSEISSYEQKIAKLPLQMRRKIQQQQQRSSHITHGSDSIIDEQETERSPRMMSYQEDSPSSYSPNVFTSIVDKKMQEQRLRDLEQQEEQIVYISQLSDMYIRCKKQNQPVFVGMEGKQQQQDSMRDSLMHQRSANEKQELEQIAEFISSVKPYPQPHHNNQTFPPTFPTIVNDLITNIRLHTTKQLTQKCQNLVRHGHNNQKLIIQKYLIKNCKSIILGENYQQLTENNSRIVNRFIEKILDEVIYYDVSYQKIVLMEVLNLEGKGDNNSSSQDVVQRRKVQFLPKETDKHFQTIKNSLQFHIDKVDQLKTLLCDSNEIKIPFTMQFDKIVEKHISSIKGTLQYILPFLNIKSRKELMSILTHGKDEVIEFQDLVLRLKFKGQDGEMFMNNLDALFARLIEINKDNQSGKQKVKFNDTNFQTLISFFELGIFQAEQSLIETSSKAIMKLTTNLSRKVNEKSSQQSTLRQNSKKLFNMIFFSVSNLIDRLDQLLDGRSELFCTYCQDIKATYEEKVNEWLTKLILVRERVRVRIHEE